MTFLQILKACFNGTLTTCHEPSCMAFASIDYTWVHSYGTREDDGYHRHVYCNKHGEQKMKELFPGYGTASS